MSDERLAAAASQVETNTSVLVRLETVRAQFTGLLDQKVAAATSERL
jgi:hypothetical protein